MFTTGKSKVRFFNRAGKTAMLSLKETYNGHVVL